MSFIIFELLQDTTFLDRIKCDMKSKSYTKTIKVARDLNPGHMDIMKLFYPTD